MNNPNDNTAHVYDLVSTPLKGREITDEEIALISSLTPPNSNILDIGAGTGRHLLPLSELGYSLTGIDSSSKMLDELRSKLKIKNSKLKEQPEIIEASILDYNLPSTTYNLIILMWNAFNEIVLNKDDAIKLFTKLKDTLSDSGKVLINSDDPYTTNMKEVEYTSNYHKEGKDYEVKWKSIDYDEKENITTSSEEVSDGDKIYKSEIKQRWWTEHQYKSLADEVGFKLERIKLKRNNEMYLVLMRE